MNTPTRSLVLVSLVLAAGLGGYFLGRATADAGPADDAAGQPAEARPLREEVARLRRENDGLSRKLTQATASAAAAATAASNPDTHATRMAQLRALADAQRNKTARIDLPIITREGKLADGFSTMFDLTPAETAALGQAVDARRQQMAQMLAANAKVTTTDDAITVTVKPFDGGGDVYDGLMEAFARTLGPERNELFLALQTDQLTRAFNSFGAEERSLTFTREAGGEGKEPRLSLNDRQKTPRSSSSSTMSYPSLAKLPEPYAWVLPLVAGAESLPVRPRR
ncbi:MAG: hypothetical protein NTV51_16780 [Verrucomicrobia bacterium]|nr:hypothetical protein [Verrucomicrobiota bacterium]